MIAPTMDYILGMLIHHDHPEYAAGGASVWQRTGTLIHPLNAGDSLQVDGDLFISESLRHTGDLNTRLKFQNELVQLEANGIVLLTVSGDAAPEYSVEFNRSQVDTDVVIHKNTADVAYTYDSGDDVHKFNAPIYTDTIQPYDGETYGIRLEPDTLFIGHQHIGLLPNFNGGVFIEPKVATPRTHAYFSIRTYASAATVFEVDLNGDTRVHNNFRFDGTLSVNGTSGYTGTFLIANGDTVTVTNGIITNVAP